MTDYSELVKALRERALRENEWYEHGGDIIEDAAAAIEDLQAQLPKRGEIVRCKECRWGTMCVTGQHLGLDGFCSKGERKVQDADK